jgi:thymidylate synthase
MNRKKEVNPLSLDKQYQLIAESILDKGVDKQDRTGTGTKSIFSAYIKHDMEQGFPLLTTKRVYWKAVVTELLWFLRGETNIKWLVENGNNIWVGDAYKSYYEDWKSKKSNDWHLSKEEFIKKIKTDDEFADKWGELGPIYGAQWRDWGGTFSTKHMNRDGSFGIHFKGIDQIQQAIHTLKTDPDSRRIIVNAWNVDALDNMVLPPCHWAFELYSEIDQQDKSNRKLSLKWHQRSVDLPLGLPFNIASYGLLLSIIAKEVGMKPDRLVGDLTNVHIYNNQVEGIEEQITRKPNTLPELVFKDPFWDLCDKDMSFSEKIKLYKPEWFTIEDYMPHPTIKFPLSN